MIPLMSKASLTEAKYTKLLKDVSQTKLTAISTLFSTFETNSDELYKHFLSKFRYYEIIDSDEDVFVQCITDIYEEHLNYFQSILTAYKKDIDIDDITTKTSTRTDTNEGEKESSGSTTTDNTHREYDLPNKVISSTDENGYLTAKDTTNNTGTVSDSESHSNTYTSDNTSKDNKDFIRLKREYLAHIRDIYEEFTDRFYDCFIHVY